MKARTEVILAISRDVAVLEMGEYERGAGDIADLGGAGGDVQRDATGDGLTDRRPARRRRGARQRGAAG